MPVFDHHLVGLVPHAAGNGRRLYDVPTVHVAHGFGQRRGRGGAFALDALEIPRIPERGSRFFTDRCHSGGELGLPHRIPVTGAVGGLVP